MKRRRKKNAKPSLDITLDGLFFPPRILCVHLTEPVDGFAYSRVLHLRTIHTIFDHHWCMSSKHRVQKNKVRWTLFERKQHNTNHKQNKKNWSAFLGNVWPIGLQFGDSWRYKSLFLPILIRRFPSIWNFRSFLPFSCVSCLSVTLSLPILFYHISLGTLFLSLTFPPYHTRLIIWSTTFVGYTNNIARCSKLFTVQAKNRHKMK